MDLMRSSFRQRKLDGINYISADFTNTVFYLAEKKCGATIIVNSKFDYDFDLVLCGTPVNEIYTSQRLITIFEDKSDPLYDGAVVINLFPRTTIYSAANKLHNDPADNWEEVATKSAIKANLIKLGARHWSAYSASRYIQALVIVVCEKGGRVSLFKNGYVVIDVTRERLKDELTNAYSKIISLRLETPLPDRPRNRCDMRWFAFNKPRRSRENLSTDFTKAVFRLAKKKVGATVIINTQMVHNTECMLKNTVISGTVLKEPYKVEKLTAIFLNKDSPLHDGAVVINLYQGPRVWSRNSLFGFDESYIYSAGNKLQVDSQHNWEELATESAIEANLTRLGTRHWLAYSASRRIQALVVVVSEERGRVSLFKNGNVIIGVTKERLNVELMIATYKENGYPKQSSGNDSSSPLYGPRISKHFRAYFTSQSIDFDNDRDTDWFCKNMVECQMQLPMNNTPELNPESNNFKRANYDKMRETCFQNAQMKLVEVRGMEHAHFLILCYGPQRLGGILYVLNEATRTIDLQTPTDFAKRELFNNDVLVYFLKEKLCKEIHPGYNQITFRYDLASHDSLTQFIRDLNSPGEICVTCKINTTDEADPTFSGGSASLGKIPQVQELKAELTPNHIEESCERLLIRLEKKSDEEFGFTLNQYSDRRITWIISDSIAAKQLRVGDKIVAIDGVELSSEIKELKTQIEEIKSKKVLDLQISRPINSDGNKLFEISV